MPTQISSTYRKRGVFPKNYRPSARPLPPAIKIDSLHGMQKFVFIFIQKFPESMDIFDRLKKLLSRSDSCCVAVAGCLTINEPVLGEDGQPLINPLTRDWLTEEKFLLDIAEIEFPECTRIAIIKQVALLANKYNFEECYTDKLTRDWLSAGNAWNILCGDQKVDLALHGIERHHDPMIRQLSVVTPFNNNEIGLTKELRNNPVVQSALKEPGNSIITDTVAGVIDSSVRYK